MNTIAEKLKTTYLGLAGLTTSMRQLLSVGAKEVTSQEISNKLNGVAQESTSQEILEEVKNIDIDTTDLAKEATAQEILEEVGNSNGALQSLADSWNAMVVDRNKLDGYVFEDYITITSPGDILYNRYQLVSITDPRIKECNTIFYNMGLKKLRVIDLPNCINIANEPSLFRDLTSLEVLRLNSLTSTPQSQFCYGCKNLRELRLTNSTSSLNVDTMLVNCNNLILLEIGAAMNSGFSITRWSPSNALLQNSQSLLTKEDLDNGFTSNLQKLLYNIREHIAANLPVLPFTITFSAGVKAAILADQETADAFTNKGWTIA